MSYEDPEKQLSINVSVAIKAAVELAVATDNPFGNFFENVENLVDTVLEVQATKLAQAGLGASTVPAAQPPAFQPAAPAPFVPQIVPPATVFPPAASPFPAAVPAPAPIPGATDGDPQVAALWQNFAADVQAGRVAGDFRGARDGQWFDNRVGKTEKAPDFKVKGSKDQALWINDKKNPSWAQQVVAAVR